MNKIKNPICFIPARSGSTRLKNKNLKLINNKTLVEITIKQALLSKKFKKKDIVLSSDCTKILSIGKKFNICCVKRSKKNSRTFSKVEDAIVEFHKKKCDYAFRDIILLQVTSPLREIKTIQKFINFCYKKEISHCLSVTEIHGNISNFSKKFFNSLNKKRLMTQQIKPFLCENGLIYFVKGQFFKQRKKIYPKRNWSYFITNPYESIDINDIEDFKICKKIMEKK